MIIVEIVYFIGVGQVAFAGLCIGLSVWSSVQTSKLFDAYLDGNKKAGEAIVEQTIFDAILTIGLSIFSATAKPALRLTLKKKLIKTLGADVLEELLSGGAKPEELSKLVTNLKKLGLSDELIFKFARSFGNDGLLVQ